MTESIATCAQNLTARGHSQLSVFLGTCSASVAAAHLSVIYTCQAAWLGQLILPGKQMSRNPDISTEQGNICAVGSEHSDGDSQKATGTLGCGTDISDSMEGLEGTSQCSHSLLQLQQTVSGQNRRMRGFYLCQRLVLLLRMSLHFSCLDLLLSAWRLCSLSTSLFR